MPSHWICFLIAISSSMNAHTSSCPLSLASLAFISRMLNDSALKPGCSSICCYTIYGSQKGGVTVGQMFCAKTLCFCRVETQSQGEGTQCRGYFSLQVLSVGLCLAFTSRFINSNGTSHVFSNISIP